jgi:hypothetical protein
MCRFTSSHYAIEAKPRNVLSDRSDSLLWSSLTGGEDRQATVASGRGGRIRGPRFCCPGLKASSGHP